MSALHYHVLVNILELAIGKGRLHFWSEMHVQEIKQILLSLNIWRSFKGEKLQALPISSNHAGLWNTAHRVWVLTNISSSKMKKTRETVVGEMLIPGLGTGLLPRREWQQKMALQKQNSFSGNQQGNQGPSSLSSREHHSGTPSLDCSNFSNPQLHTPIYYSPLKFIISGSLQLLCYSVQFSCSVVSNTLRPHGLQHARLPCPSPSPRACSNSCPLSQWCRPTISPSVVSFSSHLQSFPASGFFPLSQFFVSGGQSIGVSASASVFPVNIQDWFLLGWTGLISLQSKGLSRVFSNTTVQKHQFFGTKLSSQANSHIHTWPLEKP